MRNLTTDNPYQKDIFTVKQYGEHNLKIAYLKSVRESGWEDNREFVKKGTVNEDKLDNNISRAKSRVREYVLCNPWDYWCTFTISKDNYDRYDLDTYFKAFAKFLNNYNRCEEEHRVSYLLVPEKHMDGAWHIHGFIKGIRPTDLYINKHGYLSWKQYEKKFGYISMDSIKDLDKASSYILKYMTKDTEKNVTDIHRHLFYASKGLKRATEVYRGKAIMLKEWQWEHPEGYCKIYNVDKRIENINEVLKTYDECTESL